MANILIVSDAWIPQINGVVTTLVGLQNEANQNSDTITVVHPGSFNVTIKQSYPAVSFFAIKQHDIIDILLTSYDHVHIATPESCLGYQFISVCRKLKIEYSCAYHTKFPEFLNANYHIPLTLGWKWIQHVLQDSSRIITTTASMVAELQTKISNQNIVPWIRGVDTNYFKPGDRCSNIRKMCGHPILITVARISPEKGLENFCETEVSERATRLVIGDGPYKTYLEKKYPKVVFIGSQTATELVAWYQTADCFVFTSKKDTFGAVMLESMACGTPVAAYPVTGPKDIIKNGINGYVDESLSTAIEKCLDIDRQKVYNEGIRFSWNECYKQFKSALVD